MLALYRAQRQSDALEAYQTARRTLVEELGVEPSPALQRLQQAILRQDPALEPRSTLRLVPRRRWRLLGLAAAAALVGLAVGLFLAFRGGTGEPPPLVDAPPRSVAVIDPRTDRLVAAIPLSARPLATQDDPQGVAVGYGSVWVTDGGQQTVLRIDPATKKVVATIGIGTDVRGLAVGFGSIWVAGGSSATVTRIDPRSNRVAKTIPLGSSTGVANGSFAIAAGAGGIWTTSGADAIARIDPATNRVAARSTVPAVFSLAANARHVWAGTWVSESAIFQLDRNGSRTTFATVDPEEGVGVLAVRETKLWAIVATGTTVLERYDVTTGRLEQTLDVGRGNTALAFTADAVWIGDYHDVVRVDPHSGRVLARIPLGRQVVALAAGDGFVWVAVQS
jgi:streptogramin lyase